MKKILFVITKSNWGGAQRYVYTLATQVPRGEFEIAVALGGTGTAYSQPGELATRLQASGVRTIEVKSFTRNISIFADVRTFLELVRIFKGERPDVVHLNSSKAGGVGALAAQLCGIRNIVFTSHGLAWDEDRNILSKSFIYVLSRLTFLLCRHVIVISSDNFARARAGIFCRNRVTLIHNGLPDLQFESRERARLSLALKSGVAAQEDGVAFWFGTIAELTRNKGLSYLIEAMALLAHAGEKAHLFIIGSGEEEPLLQKRIEKHNLKSTVHLVGFVADAYRYDKGFDCFVLASVKEGLPTVLLEAAQATVPIVATNIPGVRDIIEDGVTGMLVEPKEPTALADVLKTAMKDAQKGVDLAEALRKKITSKFTAARMIEETLAIYRS